jgi:LytS/YehU family sensor histidine kinase
VYRSRREATFRKREFELELSKSSMEMRALRSQVNPHFIFNCLASIQHFISKNDNKQAEYYLVRFSRLIRQVLENSTQNMVALAEDLEALEMYVEMERLRLQNQFDFHLKIDDSIDTEEVFIPPLIIQPLVENAIWHGVGAEGEKTQITVEIKPGEKHLECIVENPLQETGMKKVSYKRKSLGLALIKERLELLNGIYDTDCSLSQEDVGYISKRTKIEIPIERE